MKKTISKIRVALVAVVTASFVFGFVVATQNVWAKRAIVMSPMSQRVLLVPGETYEGIVKITNPGDSTEDLYYSTAIGPYVLKPSEGSKDDYGDYSIEEKTSLNIIMDWITLKNGEGVLGPGEEAKIKFTIEVPEDAPAGAQYASLLVKEGAEIKTDGDGMGIGQTMQMAHIIYAQVAGNTSEEGDILENSIPSFLLDGKLNATSMVENKGNVYADAEFVLQVWPMGSDEEICTNEENAEERFVLPSTKKYHTESCVLPGPGIYKAKQTVKIFGETSVMEATIVYCPIWLMLVIVFGIVMIVMWLVMATRGRKKKAARAEVRKDVEEKSDKNE